MTRPARIQLRRTKGWRKPADAVVVARPGRFGNPFRVGEGVQDGGTVADRAEAVQLFREWITGDSNIHVERRAAICAHLRELRGRDLACWCPLDGPCHADVLLELANR